MTTLPQEWAFYARVQKGADRARINSRYWAADEAADAALEMLAIPAPTLPAMTTGIKNIATNRAAKHRHRHRILHDQLWPMMQDLMTPAVEGQIIAMSELERIQRRLSRQDWCLLVEVAQGSSYGSLAAERSETVGALKMRVSRLRKLLLH
jgi:hypothetical protein